MTLKEPGNGRAGDRSIGIDLVKSVSILFVICVHFSLNTKYYITPVSDLNMAVQSFLRWLFVPCVPLFILSTGYLNHKKVYDRGYFKKILRVVIPYLVISLLCIIIKEIENPGPIAWKNDIYTLFNFTADSYSWYVNMFIGLYLIAPALNIVFHTLDRKQVHILFGILILLVMLPMTFNPIFTYSQKFSFFFFPDWWQDIYPVLYYFIGAYISKFKPKVSIALCAVLLAALAGLQTLFLVLARPYLQNNWALTSYGSIFIMAESICIFLLLVQADTKNKAVRWAVRGISTVTLEIYLFSYIVDTKVYGWLSRNVFGELTQQQIFAKYFIIIVPLVFLSSLALAAVFHLLYGLIAKAGKRIRRQNPEPVLQAAVEQEKEPSLKG